MAEFRISRIRYTWRGNWATATAYNKDDVVRYGAQSWVCVRQHTSSAFQTNQEFLANPDDTDFTPAWIKMTDGYSYRSIWNPTTLYNPGDIVAYGGNLYLNLVSHTSGATFDQNDEKWVVYSSQINFREDWTQNTRYGIGDVVRYNGIVYKCRIEHTSGSTSLGIESGNNDDNDDSTLELWEIYYEGVEYRGDFQSGTRYRENDLVTYNGSVQRCIIGHTSSTFDDTNWQTEFPGTEFDQEWDSSTYYGIGSVVRNGGFLFYAVKASYNQSPIDSIYGSIPGTVYWAIVSKGINFRGDYSTSTTYKTGDVVRRGGNLYVAKLDTVADGSSLDYLDDSNWEVVVPSQNWRGIWGDDVVYNINDLIIYLGSLYQCNTAHTSTDQNFPGDNGSGFFYWDLVLEAASPSGLKNRGDLLTYDLSRSEQQDGSTFGVTSVVKGTEGQILSINSDDSIIYKSFGEIARVFYVATNGVDDSDDPRRGISPFSPWRTVRFACDRADDGFSGTTTIRVAAGKYEEILPIIIPARTVVLGTELRTTTISAATAIESLSEDNTYTRAALVRISNIMQDLFLGNPIAPTPGNTVPKVDPQPRQIQTGVDIVGLPIFTTIDGKATTAESTLVRGLISNINAYINFYVNSTGSAPTMTGSNTASTSADIESARLILESNKNFLAEEAVAFTRQFYPDYDFDGDKCKRDVKAFIDAWKYDLLYTGNYKSLMAARYYSNAVLGSQTEDMFYCRDSTGVRNCTLTGLQGTLNPPNVFDLYRRPTGGSYISLDPGWGPADERCWIINRSPYIQGVTTFGSACVGQKIDGALHNGGNKSIVSNDFTQVIDEGIGAWVLNQGRAELVSVFTYYSQIGYFAENGGIIRGTNGNCSYGVYGAIADGIDDSEVPITASVFNRNQEASVAAAFAGDFVDEIQILEYDNCGENYSQASASFVGAGIGAEVVYDDFRDNAVFEARLLDTSTGLNQVIGGSGYTVVQSNAQVHATPGGDATSITIASNDPNDESNYLGMRILITSGQGTGQYGYITAYNNSTKVVSVSRESDDQPGWDHVQSGKPLAVFNTSTVYRIEPRVIFSAPEYSSIDSDTSVTTDWASIVYGETTETYTNIAAEEGSGTTIEVIPVVARFNIVKSGREYTVTLASGGAGYAVGDEFTITGNLVGGASPRNDINFIVTAVSDDSTNSIVTFTYTGTGSSGRFVALTNGGSAAVYSSNATTWTAFNMPSSGDWRSLAAGNNRFVAVRYGSSTAATSNDGVTWTARSMPASRNWNSVAYGDGTFLAVAGNLNSGAFSRNNGVSWSSTTLPTVGDSTINEWVDVTYGKGKFVVLANSNNLVAIGTYNSTTNTWSWTSAIMDVVADSTQKDWISITYGNNRFVAVSTTGDVAYSFDAETWYPAEMPSQDGSTAHYWRKIRYAQGVFFAVGDTGSRDIGGDPSVAASTFAATSYNGLVWEPRTLAESAEWRSVAFGNPFVEAEDSSVGKNTPMWVAIASNSSIFSRIRTGARAQGRVTVSSGIIRSVRIWDPGSGYIDPPTITFVDPNNGNEANTENRLGDGVLPNPSWINRGLGYRTSSTRVTITGNGYADVKPIGKFITITALPNYPGPGAQIRFTGNDTVYTVVSVESVTATIGGDSFSARIRISPDLKVRDNIEHGLTMTIREKYSQVRITGHDFLDVGTGNFLQTNYPELYSDLYASAPENEVYEEDGGRVFYTSTDQSGNFRTGELFAVEQATGIVTISADFFDLSGLTELRLGGIRVGGTGAVVREFSTDTLFTEDSNNIVPTQKAIAAYLANRLSLGGSEIATASFIAGTVRVGPDFIGNTAGLRIVVPVQAHFDGSTSGISGSMMAQTMFFRSFAK